MSDNVKPLFGVAAELSDRVKAILAHIETNMRNLESEGYEIQSVVGVMFASSDNADAYRTFWDTDTDESRANKGLIAYAGARLLQEATR